jgi:hypothetical protein
LAEGSARNTGFDGTGKKDVDGEGPDGWRSWANDPLLALETTAKTTQML